MFRYFLTRLSPKLPDTSIIFPVSKLSLESYDVEQQKWCDDPKQPKTLKEKQKSEEKVNV